MMAARVIVSVWALFLTLIGATNGLVASEVGELGDIRKIAIRGATTFTPDEIREQLWCSLDVQAAAYRHSLLDDFTAVLEDKVSEGYRYAGFVDVKVSTEVDQSSMDAIRKLPLRDIPRGRVRACTHAIQRRGASDSTACVQARTLPPATARES